MNSAFYQTTDHAGAMSSADREGRVATTITLAAVATCMVLAKSLAVTHPPVVQRDEAPAVRIVDPDFCKNQTWPYIDARCLKRVAPDQPAAENHTASVPANPNATPAPVPASSLASLVTNGAAKAAYSISATPNSALPSTAPMNVMNGAGQNQPQETVAPMTSAAAIDSPASAVIADSHRTHRSQHWQHGAFFGFRF
jgi:hypothetical protein